ncbi:streptophobe family protein [Streptacidiphilus sp. EB129]|uniref:streptophobe family protein n=1 Tax=Streptacidiphilus sp. EB129 TaxID=3156262 RepID=UPI003513F8DB
MTIYGHQRPAGSGGLRDSVAYGMVSAAVAASWSFVAMAATAALGVHLLGLDTYASLGALTAALVAMATGGRISPSGDVSVFGLDAAAAQGSIGIIPLGVSVVGAVVLGWLFVRPLHRLPVLHPGVLLGRLAGAVGAFLVLLAVVAWSGNGTVAINLNSVPGLPGGGGSGGGGSDPLGGLGGDLGGLGGLVGGAVGGNTKPTVGFTVDLLPTLGLGLVWVLVVLLVALLASRRTPVPVGWEALGRQVRPVASAVVTVLLGTVLVAALSGIAVGLMGNGGAKTVGGALLGTPNGVFLAVPLGMAVPLNGKASGPLTHFLPSPVDQLLKGGSGQTITLSHLASLDGRVWLLPAGVALMLLAVGVFAAVRTPLPALPQSPVREAGEAGLRMGVALAVVTPVLLSLAGVSVNADLSVFGFDAVGAGLSISGNLLLAVVLGLVEGAVFGFLGALLVARFAAAKRVALAPAGARHPQQSYPGQSPPQQSYPQSADALPYPQQARPPQSQPTPPPYAGQPQYGQPSGPPQPAPQPSAPPRYGGLPQAPRPGQAPPAPDNPYRRTDGPAGPPPGSGPGTPPGPPPVRPPSQPPGGYNPYSGGPAQSPPPQSPPPNG